MATAQFVFYAELNDFLPAAQRGRPCVVDYASHQTLKHLIESLGVPHVEFGRLLVDDEDASPSLQPPGGSRIEIFPGHNLPPGGARFVLDNHLGRLAAYLRMLGLDTLYRNDYHDQELAEVASQEERILLTRDRRLLMRKVLLYGYCIRHLEPPEQLVEVLSRYQLLPPAEESPTSFQRCLRCNTLLQPVSKQSVLERLQPLTRLYYEEFHLCPTCDQVYWKGSHVEHMQAMIRELRNSGAEYN
jgi:uncharacterized protein with PIN domain